MHYPNNNNNEFAFIEVVLEQTLFSATPRIG